MASSPEPKLIITNPTGETQSVAVQPDPSEAEPSPAVKAAAAKILPPKQGTKRTHGEGPGSSPHSKSDPPKTPDRSGSALHTPRAPKAPKIGRPLGTQMRATFQWNDEPAEEPPVVISFDGTNVVITLKGGEEIITCDTGRTRQMVRVIAGCGDGMRLIDF